jgi:hypothetical protein
MRLISRSLVKSVTKEGDRVSAVSLWLAAQGAERLATFKYMQKVYLRYCLISPINTCMLYYCVIKLRSFKGDQSWCEVSLTCKIGYGKSGKDTTVLISWSSALPTAPPFTKMLHLL